MVLFNLGMEGNAVSTNFSKSLDLDDENQLG